MTIFLKNENFESKSVQLNTKISNEKFEIKTIKTNEMKSIEAKRKNDLNDQIENIKTLQHNKRSR